MIQKNSTVFSRLLAPFIFAILLLNFFSPTTVGADKAAGLTVTPAQVNLVVNATQPAAEQTITLTSTYDVPVRFGVELRAID
ncbi:hypothetical protein KDA14_04390, partial [Candidatus Saccharibacteria bacterium]|nr:hypothetical protein [Candidatus Saccharibacteria bacterium]